MELFIKDLFHSSKFTPDDLDEANDHLERNALFFTFPACGVVIGRMVSFILNFLLLLFNVQKMTLVLYSISVLSLYYD